MGKRLIIRPARAADRPAMERICAHTWEDGDYIPRVWDRWLADEQGVLLVGELDTPPGEIVALQKITFQTPDQVWLQGMRVDPAYRRQGIAGQFLKYSLAYARQLGARVVRLGTGEDNQPVHIIAARAGMERVGVYTCWSAEPLAEGPRPTILTPESLSQVRAFLQASPVFTHTHHLTSIRWSWQELSAERVVDFLNSGQMAAHLTAEGELAALATIHFIEDEDEMWIGFADGQPEAVARLALAVRVHAGRVGAAHVRIMVPDVAWLREAFQSAGYGPGDWTGDLWVFERRLAGEAEG
ncbi:MAG: GNAT family N-acetyltransferase [Anaerolineae bacterium]